MSVCLSVCSLSPPRSFDRSSPNFVGVCRWTSELPLRGSFSKRSTARRVNGSLSLSTILYMCQPHSTQLQKATLLLLHLIRLKGTFCCIDGWWVYLGVSRWISELFARRVIFPSHINSYINSCKVLIMIDSSDIQTWLYTTTKM